MQCRCNRGSFSGAGRLRRSRAARARRASALAARRCRSRRAAPARSNTTALTPFSRWNTSPSAAELQADPLPSQHFARRHDHRLLIVGVEVGLDRIADDEKSAILQGRCRRPVDRVDIGHRNAELAPARPPLRTELPQFADQLTAERIARAEAADLGVGASALIDPILEALKLGEVRARRARQPGDRREAKRIERRGEWREGDRAQRGHGEERGARPTREDEHQRAGDRRGDRRRDQIEMMDVGSLDAQEQRGGDGGCAESETHEAPVARARPKEDGAGQRRESGDQPDPVAELAQEHVRRLAIAGVSLGVVMRAQVRRPIDEDGT